MLAFARSANCEGSALHVWEPEMPVFLECDRSDISRFLRILYPSFYRLLNSHPVLFFVDESPAPEAPPLRGENIPAYLRFYVQMFNSSKQHDGCVVSSGTVLNDRRNISLRFTCPINFKKPRAKT